jgi:hypothetical protein
VEILHGAADGDDPDQDLEKSDHRSKVFITLGHENNPHCVEGNIANPQAKNQQGKQEIIKIGRIEDFHLGFCFDFQGAANILDFRHARKSDKSATQKIFFSLSLHRDIILLCSFVTMLCIHD